jgi:cysteinyl-tRNA synthetase
VLRYYLGTPHYRSMIEYSEEALREAESAFARIEGFVQRVVEKAGGVVEPAAEVPPAFAEAMDDDLGVPQALAVVHTTVRQGNSALAADDKEAAVARLAEVRAMLGVLGLDPLDPHWAGEGGDRGEDLHGVVDTLVRMVLDQREAARGRKDWAHRRRHPGPAQPVRPGHRGRPAGPALDPRPPLNPPRSNPDRTRSTKIDCAARPSGRHTA